MRKLRSWARNPLLGILWHTNNCKPQREQDWNREWSKHEEIHDFARTSGRMRAVKTTHGQQVLQLPAQPMKLLKLFIFSRKALFTALSSHESRKMWDKECSSALSLAKKDFAVHPPCVSPFSTASLEVAAELVTAHKSHVCREPKPHETLYFDEEWAFPCFPAQRATHLGILAQGGRITADKAGFYRRCCLWWIFIEMKTFQQNISVSSNQHFPTKVLT